MTDIDSFTFIDLFAGIGGFRIAFEELGGRCVFASEIDPTAQETYEANFGERPAGDIREIGVDAIPDHDFLLAGFPCQAFSIMGKMEGFADTRGTLFFEIERILEGVRPPYLLLENVPQLLSNQGGKTFKVIQNQLRSLGYHIHHCVLNALDFGLPQKRERVYIAGFQENYSFDFPTGNSDYCLADVLEPDSAVSERYMASDYIRKKREKAVRAKEVFYPSVWHENRAGNVSIHDFSCALRANASYNYLLVNGVRHLTPTELLRLQGFPDDFEIRGSYTQIRSQTGNAVPIPVVRAMGEAMLRSIRSGKLLPHNVLSSGQTHFEWRE